MMLENIVAVVIGIPLFFFAFCLVAIVVLVAVCPTGIEILEFDDYE
jgi:hypothetical protein